MSKPPSLLLGSLVGSARHDAVLSPSWTLELQVGVPVVYRPMDRESLLISVGVQPVYHLWTIGVHIVVIEPD